MKFFIAKLTTAFLLLLFSLLANAKTIRYELTVENKKVNITGNEVDFALMVNGSIPAPTLEFTEGDEAEITVYNRLPKEEVSIHWHGILLPPEEDGVAYVNTPPIFPGKSHTFRFKIRQHGTYWYHSHTAVQEQKGVYGALVIHPKKEIIKADREAVVVLSDWSDENADQILRHLKKDGDYYQYKKKTLRSIFGAAQAGELKTYFQGEWQRMGGMDLSDVGYDAFLINGKKESQLLEAHPGEKIRLRIINAAASSYFYVSLGKTPVTVISADGVDIDPVQAKEILIAMAETYDVLFTVPEHRNYELRATAQDGTGFASAWIGMGEKVSVKDRPAPDLYAPMNHGGGPHESHGSHGEPAANQSMDEKSKPVEGHTKMDHSQMHHSEMNHPQSTSPSTGSVIDTLTVNGLKAQKSTVLPAKAKVFELQLVLGGDMERYIWHINGKAIQEDRTIVINEGDVVRFTFENTTMMHHPMHLHGHFFRVLNQNAEFSPLKHTVDVPPHGSRTIEFYANEPGQWMLHCHNLYHMKTGMARVVKYMSYEPRPEMKHLEKHDPHLHDHWYQSGDAQIFSNIFEGHYKFSQTWNEIELRGESRKDEDWNGSGDLFYKRWFDNYLNFIAGASAVDHDYRGEIGVGYILPFLLDSHLLVDHKGKLRVDLQKRFQWTQTLFTDFDYIWRQDPELDSEYGLSLMYGRSWAWSAGLQYTGHSLGVGFNYRF
ncbi:MAG: multicopper oxidase domain-containing protein [Pseudobdellovibrionaceae bacterium]